MDSGPRKELLKRQNIHMPKLKIIIGAERGAKPIPEELIAWIFKIV